MSRGTAVQGESAEAFLPGAIAGDRAAFGRLIVCLRPTIFTYCMGILRDCDEAEDATQEVCLRLLRVLSRYDITCPFRPWLLRIARNICIDFIRNRLRRQRRTVTLHGDGEQGLERIFPDPQGTPATDCVKRELGRLLVAAIGALRPRYRQAILLKYCSHMCCEEIAAHMDTSIVNVSNLLHRARKALAAGLAAEVLR
jgi:RNA polymerase sigma-70 factor (ECF subfamily)